MDDDPIYLTDAFLRRISVREWFDIVRKTDRQLANRSRFALERYDLIARYVRAAQESTACTWCRDENIHRAHLHYRCSIRTVETALSLLAPSTATK
jgi:hypothetical protein